MSSDDPGPKAPSAEPSGESRPLSRIEVLRALRISNAEAVLATVHGSLTGGAFQTGFVLLLGASSFWLGVIGAIPTFAALVQVISSLWVEQMGRRKQLTAWFSLMARSLWLPILLIPFVLPRPLWLPAFLVLFTLSSVAIQVPVPAITSWLSDLVPEDHRGRYFGRRNMLAGWTTLAATIPTAWLLDHATSWLGISEVTGFAVLFAVAVACGVGGFALILRMAEPPMTRSARVEWSNPRQLLGLYARPLKDAAFRTLLLFSAAFSAAQFFAAPFYTAYALQNLSLGYVWLQILGGVASLAALLAMPLWGYLSDRFGNKPLLILAVLGVTVTPLPWVLTSADHRSAAIIILLVANVFGGVAWAGVGLLQFNIMIETTPSEGRSLYVGVLSAAAGIAGGVAPVVGGALLELFRSHPLTAGSIEVNPYHAIFIVNAILRAATLPLLRKVPAVSRASPRQVIEQLSAVRVGAIRQLRQLQHSARAELRAAAASALSEARLGLAVQELALALEDPDPSVRRSAARALGEIGDPSAGPALIAALRTPELGIALEVITALGRLGVPEAVRALAEIAGSDEGPERIAALEALGAIRTPEAASAVLRVFQRALQNGQEELLEAASLAAGAQRLTEAVDGLLGLLQHVSRRVRLAAIRALGDIGDRRAVPYLAELMRSAQDPTVLTAASFALAQCGGTEAVADMFRIMGRLPSPASRKQVANAIAVLLGDRETYRLLTIAGMEREEAIARSVEALARDQRRAQGQRVRRRSVLLQRAAKTFAEGDLGGATELLLKAAPTGDAPAHALLAIAASSLQDREPTEEEFLAILAAVRSALRTEAPKG